MEKLKIIDSYRQELTTNGIVICTYLDMQDNEVDCIDLIYQEQYPQFELIEVQQSTSDI